MPELGSATYELVFHTQDAIAGVEATEAAVNTATANIEGDLAATEAAMERTGVAAQEMGAASARGAAESTIASAKMRTTWGMTAERMTKAGHSISRAFTLPVALVTGIGAKMALDYSNKIKLLQTQAGATASEMEAMRGEVLKFAAAGAEQGPTQLADALYHVESVGFRGAKAMETLKIASEGAMVGQAGLEETTYALVSAQEAALKDTQNVAATMAILNAVVGNGDMRLQDLTAALSTGITSAAKSAGLGLKDVGAAIDTMTARGQPAQISATRLGMSIAMMQKPTNAASKALAVLGIGQLDLAHLMMQGGPQGGLVAALEFLRTRLERIPDPAKRASLVLAAFGGGRSGKAMLTLLQNLDDVKQRYDAIARKGNEQSFNSAVEEAKAEPINRLRMAWTRLQVALINIGNQVIPSFVKLANGIAAVGAAFEKLPGPVKSTALTVSLLVAGLGPLLLLGGKLIKGLEALSIAMLRVGGSAKVASAESLTLGTRMAALARLGMVTIGIGLLYSSRGDHTAMGFMEHMMAGAMIGSMFGPAGAVLGAITIPIILDYSQSNAAKALAGSPLGAPGRFAAKLFGYGPQKPESSQKANGPQQAVYRNGKWEDVQGNELKGAAKTRAETVWRRSHGDNEPHEHSVVSLYAPRQRGSYVSYTSDTEHGGTGPLFKTPKPNPHRLAFKGAAPWETPAFVRQEIAQQQAAMKGSVKLQVAALTKEKAMIREWLDAKKRSLKQRLDATTEMANIDSQIKSLTTKNKQPKSGVPWGTPVFQKAELMVAQAQARGFNKMAMDGLKRERSEIQKWLKDKKRSLTDQISAWQSIYGLNQEITALRKKNLDEQKKQMQLERDSVQAVKDIRGSFFSQFAGNIFGGGPGGLTLQPEGSKQVTVHQQNHYHEIPKDRFHEARRQRKAVESALR